MFRDVWLSMLGFHRIVNDAAQVQKHGTGHGRDAVSQAVAPGATPSDSGQVAERRVEGRRAGGMDDEDLLLKTAGAQGVS